MAWVSLSRLAKGCGRNQLRHPVFHFTMKTKLPLLIAFGLVSVGAAVAAHPEKPIATVEVTFVAPEKFTDAKDDYMGTEKGQAALLDQLKEHLMMQGARVLAPNQRLEIKVTDVDLARSEEHTSEV